MSTKMMAVAKVTIVLGNHVPLCAIHCTSRLVGNADAEREARDQVAENANGRMNAPPCPFGLGRSCGSTRSGATAQVIEEGLGDRHAFANRSRTFRQPAVAREPRTRLRENSRGELIDAAGERNG